MVALSCRHALKVGTSSLGSTWLCLGKTLVVKHLSECPCTLPVLSHFWIIFAASKDAIPDLSISEHSFECIGCLRTACQHWPEIGQQTAKRDLEVALEIFLVSAV